MIKSINGTSNKQDLIFLERTGYTLDFLYKKYYPKLVYNLREKCKNHEKAEEYATEAFYIAMEKIEQYDKERGEFSTWLFRIGHNLFLIEINREKRNRVMSMDDELDSEGSTLKDYLSYEDSSDEEIEIQNIDELKSKIIKKSLHYINPELAEVIILRDIQGYSYKEISELLDINMNTLKSRIRQARLDLMYMSREAFKELDNLLN